MTTADNKAPSQKTAEPRKVAASPQATDAKKRKRPAQTGGVKKKTTTANAKSKTSSLASTLATPITLPPTHTLIVDNGGDTLKYGWSTDDKPRIPLPNISARLMHQFTTLVADELGTVQNPNSLIARTRSTERGLITNMENQTRVWKRMLDLLNVQIPLNTEAAKSFGWNIAKGKKGKTATSANKPNIAKIPAHTIAVVLLLPPHCPRVILDQILQVWFEDFGIAHVGLGVSSACASHDQILATPFKTSCTIDLGWSSTLVVPTFKDQVVSGNAIRRLPVGGRHMINMLKYYMSYRQYNLMEQTHLLREVFENLSYLSLDIKGDLAMAREKPSGRRRYDRDFVLPDYKTTSNGEIRIPPLLQRDLEREAAHAKDHGANIVEDDNDEEEDEDFEMDDDENISDEDVVMSDGEYEKEEQPTLKAGKGKKKRKQKVEEDEEDIDEGEETIEQKRKRILQERAAEERRRKEQEEEEQILRVSVERFNVPEVLFRPLDAGLQPDLMGLAHAVVQSVESCPLPYRPALYQTIYLVGGVSRLPNLKERLEKELRSLIPSEFKMKVSVAESPIDRAWFGAKAYFQPLQYLKWSVSQHEWIATGKRRAFTKLFKTNGGCYV